MDQSLHTRRRFIKTASAGVLGVAAAGCGSLVGRERRGAADAPSRAVDPSDRVVIGMIGVGSMGKNRLRELLRHPDVEIGAVCDVDSRHLDESASIVADLRSSSPRRYTDFRRVLDDADVDAVVIVTPDHWHAIPTVQACAAGKDVFVEKPLSFSVAEGRAMVNAARRHSRVTQMGNHIHNDSANYRRVVERIQSGQLGRITQVALWKTTETDGFGNPPDGIPPRELDYNMWLGPAPVRPYNPLRSHLTYRHFWDYSGGTFIDFWCHIADVAFWALDLDSPSTISAAGGRYFVDDATETPDSMHVQFTFPELLMTFTLHPRPLPGFEHLGSIGAVFVGEYATLATSYFTHEVRVDGQVISDMPDPDLHIPDSPGHLREFIDGIKSRNLETSCNVAYGHHITRVGLLANIAYRTGSTIHWEGESERIIDNVAATRLLARDYRKPWTLSM